MCINNYSFFPNTSYNFPNFPPCSKLIEDVDFHAKYQLWRQEQMAKAPEPANLEMTQKLRDLELPKGKPSNYPWSPREKRFLIKTINEISQSGVGRSFWSSVANRFPHKNERNCKRQFESLLSKKIIEQRGSIYTFVKSLH